MRTDLAKEARRTYPHIPGIREEKEYMEAYEVHRITVETDAAAQELDKPKGIYTTIQIPTEAISDRKGRAAAADVIAAELCTLLSDVGSVMVVGLGNRYITADALGTKTAENIFVTRHIQTHLADVLPQNTRTVTSFCANVLGVTGMETVEVVSALGAKIRPELILVVDSLAASDPKHIGTVIQMNDSGISPGAGIGNFRVALNRKTLGIPVVAIGIPLVVGADAIVRSILGEQDDPAMRMDWNGMTVTPKDIDALVRDAARVLSEGINRALFGDNYTELENLLQ